MQSWQSKGTALLGLVGDKSVWNSGQSTAAFTKWCPGTSRTKSVSRWNIVSDCWETDWKWGEGHGGNEQLICEVSYDEICAAKQLANATVVSGRLEAT